MRTLPVFRKKFSDVLPSIDWLRAKARRMFLGTAVTGMGALALGPTPPSQTVTAGAPVHPVEVVILNREKRFSAGKLILRLNNAFDKVIRAAHGSHSSHASHASHASHSSHTSHYSSSPGSVPSTPSPSYTPPPPLGPATPSTSSSNSAPSEAQLTKTVIEITKIDLERWTISGKTKAGKELSFRFWSRTKVHRLTPTELTQTIGMLRLEQSNSFPLELHQEVMVEWKVDTKTSERIAISFTVL